MTADSKTVDRLARAFPGDAWHDTALEQSSSGRAALAAALALELAEIAQRADLPVLAALLRARAQRLAIEN